MVEASGLSAASPSDTVERSSAAPALYGWWFAVVAAVVVFAVRLSYRHVAFGADEGYYSVVARLWLSGQRLYGDLALVRPPGIAWVYALPRYAGFHAGDGFLRVLSAVTAGLTAACIAWWIMRRTSRAAATTGLVCVIVWSCSLMLQNEGNSETWMLLPYVISGFAGFAAFDPATPPRRRVPLAVLGGLALATAALFKQVALVGLAIPLIAWAAHRAARPVAVRCTAAFWVSAVVGVMAVPGWVVGSGDDLRAYLSAVWIGASSYISYSGESTASVLGSRLMAIALPLLVPLGISMVLLGVSGLTERARVWDARLVFALGWLAVSAVGVAASGRFYPHYFLQLVPAAALMVALAAEKGFGGGSAGLSIRRLGGALVLIAVVCAVASVVVDQSRLGELERRRSRAVLLAQRADSGTPAGGRVLVWGPPAAAAYVKHELWGATPWLYYGIGSPRGVVVLGKHVPSQGDRFLRALEDSTPDTVVVAEPLEVPMIGAPVDDPRVPDAIGQLLDHGYARTRASLRNPPVGEVHARRQ